LSVDDLTAAGFNSTLAARMNANTVLPTFLGTTGPYAVGLGPAINKLSKKKEPLAAAVAKTPARRQGFAYALLVSSIFQAPMYVGKADDLRGRIKDHRDGLTGFAKRVAKYNLMPDELVVAFVPFDNLPNRTNELLEYIITVLATPPFVKRRG
jgi:hypothetical protein